MSVQPHVRKKLSPRDVLPFPWENEPQTPTPRMSREEHERRMADALARMGKYLTDDSRSSVAAKETKE